MSDRLFRTRSGESKGGAFLVLPWGGLPRRPPLRRAPALAPSATARRHRALHQGRGGRECGGWGERRARVAVAARRGETLPDLAPNREPSSLHHKQPRPTSHSPPCRPHRRRPRRRRPGRVRRHRGRPGRPPRVPPAVRNPGRGRGRCPRPRGRRCARCGRLPLHPHRLDPRVCGVAPPRRLVHDVHGARIQDSDVGVFL